VTAGCPGCVQVALVACSCICCCFDGPVCCCLLLLVLLLLAERSTVRRVLLLLRCPQRSPQHPGCITHSRMCVWFCLILVLLLVCWRVALSPPAPAPATVLLCAGQKAAYADLLLLLLPLLLLSPCLWPCPCPGPAAWGAHGLYMLC
jgi:hypothetical protein